MENQGNKKLKPLTRTMIAVLVMGALALGVLAFAPQAVQAQDGAPQKPNGLILGPGSDAGPGGHGGLRFGGDIDYDALLAEALGISVDDLQAARAKADEAAMQLAIEKGYITEEQVQLMQARKALMDYIDQDALTAQALGISVEELQTAREEGKSMQALIDELGLDKTQVQEAMQAAYQEAVQQAVADGVITQEQADLILSEGFGPHGFGDFGGRGGPGGKHGGERPPMPGTTTQDGDS
ncbi:MAG: hypothetical protein AB1894_08700 [Chloroflexota bacterium]